MIQIKSKLQYRLSSHAWAVISIILAAACWGSATVMSKALLNELPSLFLLMVQLAFSVSLLWLMTIATKQPKTRPLSICQILKVATLGTLEPGLAYGLGLFGLSMTSASVAGVIFTSEPLMVMLLALPMLGERIGRRGIFAAALTICGTAMVSQEQGLLNGSSSLLGNVLILGSTACAALYVVLNRYIRHQIRPITTAALQQSVGLLLVCLTFIFLGEMPGQMPLLLLLKAGLSGLVQYAMAFWLYLIAVDKLPVSVATLFLGLIPLFSSLSAFVFLGESMSPLQCSGAGLILMSLATLGTSNRQAHL